MVRRWGVGCLSLGLVVAGCIRRTLECPPLPGPTATAAAGTSTAAGTSLIGSGGLKTFQVQGEADKVAVTTVPVTGQAFSEALRAEIKKGSGHEWAVQLQAPTAGPVAEGDVLMASFFLRADKVIDDLAAGQTQFVFEQAKEPYGKSVIYDVQAGADWREVHVPFVAKQNFAPGEAQMIFRLGYDPETLEIAGVTVENFAKTRAIASLPRTKPWSPPKKAESAVALEVVDGGPLVVDVDPTKTVGPISPYVYGLNSQTSGGFSVPVRRMGGNRQTTYNWEIDASNAGSDSRHVSDDWACTVLGYKNCGEPAAQFLDFAAENKRLGAETIATVPMVDYVVADKDHEVSEADRAPSKRWVHSYAKKGTPFSDAPDLTDGGVYEDEFVNFLVHKLGKAAKGGIKFYSLDNEPALWPSTHPRVHPEKTTYQEMLTRTGALATAITSIDPTAMVLGGVMYGWSEYQSLQDAPDAKEYKPQYETYVDYFLSSMKDLEQKQHHRLVHALDVHWYPEARGTQRVTEDDNSPKTVDARLQAPRALWDSTYREKSWIDDAWGKPIRLVRWLGEKIAKDYPGTKLSMTEYDFGAGGHISGGLAQVDALGVLGREGVYLADYWGSGAGNGELPPYIGAAFELYRNYDGKGATYGDTAVTATVADAAKASVFAATDSKRPRLLVIVINKDQRAKYAGHLSIKGAAKYAVTQVYRLDKSAPAVQAADAKAEMHDNRLEYELPPLSATLFVCERH